MTTDAREGAYFFGDDEGGRGVGAGGRPDGANSASSSCPCLGEDAVTAREAIGRAMTVARLIDESHFIVSIQRCEGCGQHFLRAFCEEIDWADGEDPQARLMIPISDVERAALQLLGSGLDDAGILRIVHARRRWLMETNPKVAPRTLEWLDREPYLPPHD